MVASSGFPLPNQEAFTQLDFGSRFQGPPSTLRKVHPETVSVLELLKAWTWELSQFEAATVEGK